MKGLFHWTHGPHTVRVQTHGGVEVAEVLNDKGQVVEAFDATEFGPDFKDIAADIADALSDGLTGAAI